MVDEARRPMLDAADDSDRQTIARLAQEIVPTLIERLANSELGELEVRENGWRIRLRRPIGATNNGDIRTVSLSTTGGSAASTIRTDAAERPRPAERPRTETSPGLVTAVAIGYFAPRDGIATGASLRRGDVIGFVDVLGVRQEVVSPLDGVLRELDVEPGQAVEYGQPIGRVDARLEAHA